jgi:hypothetical protein
MGLECGWTEHRFGAQKPAMPVSYTLDASAEAIGRALNADPAGDVWSGGTLHAGSYAPVVLRGATGADALSPANGACPATAAHHGHAPCRHHLAQYRKPVLDRHLAPPRMRCLVPATHFLASRPRHGAPRWWAAAPQEGGDGAIMAFAGVWRDSEVPSFAIVTVAPDGLSGPDDLPAVVPLVLSPAEQERWLTQEWSKAEALVRPLHPDRIRPLGTP